MNPLRTSPTRLACISTILVSGDDARTFLQGQLSADLDSLDRQRALLASCNSSQGRVQSIVWMLERGDGIALLLPASMVEKTTARLRKYVLRSRVKVEPAGERLNVALLDRDALPGGISISATGSHHEIDGISYINLPGHQAVLLVTAQPVPDAEIAVQMQWQMQWRLEDIRAGLPQIHPETHEAFVAQMLNLDLLGGIDFEKGCYTGQEIIARTHYRGAIKRRMFRFEAPCPPPAPGTRIVVGEQHAGDVVDAAPTDDGCELLAVVSVAQMEESLQIERVPVKLVRLQLPYEVA